MTDSIVTSHHFRYEECTSCKGTFLDAGEFTGLEQTTDPFLVDELIDTRAMIELEVDKSLDRLGQILQ